MSVTAGTMEPSPPQPPALRGRRLVARLLDWLVAWTLSAAICWPFAWGQASDLLARAGLGSVGELVTGQVPLDALEGALTELHSVVTLTLTLQVIVVWLYETLATWVTGSTVGKALLRLRVVIHRPPGARPSARVGWLERLLWMGVRALLAVVPAGIAAVTVVAALLDVPGAGEVGNVAIALAIVVAILVAADGIGAHGHLSRTRVSSFEWAQVQADARARAEKLGGQALESAHGEPTRRLTRDSEQQARRLRDRGEEARRLAREAATQGRAARQQAVSQGRSVEQQARSSDAAAQAEHLATDAWTRVRQAGRGTPAEKFLDRLGRRD